MLGSAYGIDDLPVFMNELTPESAKASKSFLRSTAGLNNLLTFLLPAIVFVLFRFRKQFLLFFRLNRFPNLLNAVFGVSAVLVAMPVIQWLYKFNSSIPLPDFLQQSETQVEVMLKGILDAQSTPELLLVLLVVAVIPALGEELFFRGILQRYIERMTLNPHIAVWSIGALFSAIHMQFAGFLPRMLLGVLLGYLVIWTRSLWIPIIAHFANNALQVIVVYQLGDQIAEFDLESGASLPWYVTLLSAVAVGTMCWMLYIVNAPRRAEAEIDPFLLELHSEEKSHV